MILIKYQEFVLKEIEESAKLEEKEQAKKLEEKEKEFLQQLDKEIAKKEQEKGREWSEKLQKIKDNLKEVAQGDANKKSVVVTSILTLILLGLICFGYFYFKKSGDTGLYSLLIALTVGSGGVFGLWKYIKRYLGDYLFKYIYAKKKKEIELDEV